MFNYNSRMLMGRSTILVIFSLLLPILAACSTTTSISNTPTIENSPIPEIVIPSSQPTLIDPTPLSASRSEILSYMVINQFSHDSGAFTEGLAIYDNVLYETTGLNGRSSIRRIDLENGKIEKIRYLPDEYFGEGMAIIDKRIVWITWQSNRGFVYDLDSFDIIDSFSYDHEGWGLAYDGTKLFMSDGSDVIHILEIDTYTETGTIHVTDDGSPVEKINELEFIEGEIFANIWQTALIARIDPITGNVTGWLDLSSLPEQFETLSHSVDVLNGIAYNQETKQLFVTGKYWPKIFEIQILTPD